MNEKKLLSGFEIQALEAELRSLRRKKQKTPEDNARKKNIAAILDTQKRLAEEILAGILKTNRSE